jgi:hypothetical protein
MIPTTFTNSIEQSSKKWRAGVSLVAGSRHIRYGALSVPEGTKLEALSN